MLLLMFISVLPDVIDCHFAKTTIIDKKGEKTTADPMDMIYAQLNTKEPVMVGNAGSSAITKLETGTSVTLVEILADGLSIVTWYPGSGFALWSKHVKAIEWEYGLFAAGKCSPRRLGTKQK